LAPTFDLRQRYATAGVSGCADPATLSSFNSHPNYLDQVSRLASRISSPHSSLPGTINETRRRLHDHEFQVIDPSNARARSFYVMSLTVKHLNGDTTFLLTFSPIDQRPHSSPDSPYQAPGTFTVLIDPWLSGASSMWHPKFLLSKHTTPACIRSLSHIPEPNVVLISQVKPDHCHEATLRQLDPTSPITSILAEPAAAKKIRGMKHFHPSMVHNLRPYSEKNPDSVIRFYIPPTMAGGIPGEATISFIPAKIDVPGVHNAIGITYRPPSTNQAAVRPFTPRALNLHTSFPLSSHAQHHNTTT